MGHSKSQISMGEILRYIKDFYSKAFHWPYFLLVVALMGTMVYLNYWHQLEKKYAAGGHSWFSGFAGYYLLYFIPFATAFLLQYFFVKPAPWFGNPWFWTILLLAPAFFAFRVNFSFHEGFINSRCSPPDRIFYLRSISWVIRVLVLLLPVFFIWWLKDRGTQPFYGAAPLGNVRPYLLMLLIMVPLLALASTQSDFLQTYPKAKVLAGQSGWRYVVFELCYGFDFVSIEFFFRGFLILGLLHICGPHAIIPAACFYCTIHFGKPLGEAISSFWGGLLLGIVSYHTGSVWGGLIVHLGIAWLMEVGGWLGGRIR
jgi:hypothetical protein